MKKISVLLFSVCMAGLFSSCSKKDDIPVNDTSLAGTWRWTNTDGGIAAHIHDTPASTGKEVNLVLSNNNQYAFYTNGVLSSSGTFTILDRQCPHTGSSKQYIDFSDPADTDMTIETVVTSTLFLSDDFMDGTTSRFIRL